MKTLPKNFPKNTPKGFLKRTDRVIHQVMGWVWLNVFYEFPLLAISFLGSMAAAIWPYVLRNI